ncbi:MAG: menaquinone biosynthesis family protein [Planctomycetota bacterium]
MATGESPRRSGGKSPASRPGSKKKTGRAKSAAAGSRKATPGKKKTPAARPKAAKKKKPAPKKKPAAEKKVAEKKVAEKKVAGKTAVRADGAGRVEEAAVEAPPVAPAPKAPPTFSPRRADGTITIAYSPDADDAFMFYALKTGKVDTEDRRYELVQDEIKTLNQQAREGVYDVTAISFGAYPYLAARYLLLTCGASFGDHQGPILVARSLIRTHEVNGLTVAVPGLMTSATLALRLWLPHARLNLVEYPFDQVLPAVRTGRARAGVVIHERQLTWRAENLMRIVDFGQWWGEKTEGLPLPLGANAIRRDIPEEERAKIALDIKRSIAYGLGHREETLDYAVPFAKGLDRKTVDRYVSIYVNELALDYAERGRQSVKLFFDEALRFGFLQEAVDPQFS